MATKCERCTKWVEGVLCSPGPYVVLCGACYAELTATTVQVHAPAQDAPRVGSYTCRPPLLGGGL